MKLRGILLIGLLLALVGAVMAHEGREVGDGAIKPACAQSCPATALVFGDLNDPASAVSRLTRSGRGSKLLEDLGTQPKVTYLARQTP